MLLLIPLLPLAGFLVNAFVGRRLSKSISGGLACLAMIGSFAISAGLVWGLLAEGAAPIETVVFEWFASGNLRVPFALRLDHLAALMILGARGMPHGYVAYTEIFVGPQRAASAATAVSAIGALVLALSLVLGRRDELLAGRGRPALLG